MSKATITRIFEAAIVALVVAIVIAILAVAAGLAEPKAASAVVGSR